MCVPMPPVTSHPYNPQLDSLIPFVFTTLHYAAIPLTYHAVVSLQGPCASSLPITRYSQPLGYVISIYY